MNAQQLNLTGVCCFHRNCNVIVVEGGPKGINRYKKLMLRRIDWTETAESRGGSEEAPAVDETKEENECVLVWEGTVKNGAFRGFRFKMCPTEARVREALGSCPHYFDLAKNYDSGRSL
jgi:U4/U6 small nuclear ribonucleoprotein PRP3